MRSVILAASVALALGSVSAIGQTPRVTVTNAVGTNGSTVGTSTSGTSTTSGSGTAASGTSASTSPLANEPQVTAPSTSAGSSSTTSTSTNPASSSTPGSGNAFGTNTTTTVPTNSTPSFGPGGSFANDSGNTALGTSPGQTSSGTAAGNSSQGLGAGSATLDPSGTGAVGNGPAVTNPDGTTLGPGVNVVGERVPATNGAVPPASPSFTIINTPTFDQAAREGRAKEQARKARGQEPRVYGIAPRTENDLTHQMPDDKIIRY